MDKEKIRQYVDVAKLYYESEYSQEEIARELNISRPTVSRILQYCKDKNIVQIKIINPLQDFDEIERQLEQKYHLKRAIVAYSSINNTEEILSAICSKAAAFLNEIVKDGDVIGVSWGNTIYNVAKKLQPRMVRGVQIVQLKGGISHTNASTYAHEVVEIFAEKFNAAGRYLQLPVMFASLETKNIVEEDPYVKRILQLGRESNTAIYTVGTVLNDALLFRLGYFSEKDKKELMKSASGDLCSRFIDKRGNICKPDIAARTNGIDLSELKKKEYSILVAGGQKKWSAIKAALVGGYPNILITDQFTANELL